VQFSSGRYCMKCGGRLSRDNRASLCASCRQLSGIGSDHAPEFGSEFWYTDQMRDAFATRDMGVVVRTYRYHPAHGHKALPQETLARWLGTVTQSQLSRIESGRNHVDKLDKLIHYAQALKMPPDLLWFELPENLAAQAKPSGGVFALPGGPIVPAAGLRTGSALADSLLQTLNHYSATDNLIGPQSLVAIVPQQLRSIDEQVMSAHGRDKARLLYVAARYAEFAGWIYQDAGHLDSAMQMSSIAHDYAQEVGDENLCSYILMRRSNIASDGGRHELALRLAMASLRNTSQLSARQSAVALRQQAQAHARLGDEKAFAGAMDAAFNYAERGADAEEDIARYCTPEYLQMEAAHGWVELGRPGEAISTLQRGLAGWQPEYRRDLGLCLAMLAVAHAGNRQIENAVVVGDHALEIARETGSHRTETQLARIPGLLTKEGAEDEARKFDRRVRLLRS
jgi:transcriptional regulator with XRE-family HTH domain